MSNKLFKADNRHRICVIQLAEPGLAATSSYLAHQSPTSSSCVAGISPSHKYIVLNGVREGEGIQPVRERVNRITLKPKIYIHINVIGSLLSNNNRSSVSFRGRVIAAFERQAI